MTTNSAETFLHFRRSYQPKVPPILKNLKELTFASATHEKRTISSEVAEHFKSLPATTLLIGQKLTQQSSPPASQAPVSNGPWKVGVVLSGGQAPGGHNVICGLWQGLQQLHKDSTVIGFLGGPSGILAGKFREITGQLVQEYKNTGGFDMIGSGRTKIETPEQFATCAKVCRDLALNGLVIIGGDDSNTNAALLAEYFVAQNHPTVILGVPKTIDGDLQSQDIEISFGFDTAARVYAELISNIAVDTRSARKYYHFIRLMGRSASHITLECALRTRPNVAFISEEIRARGQSLTEICQHLADVVIARSKAGKDFGVVLIPEGLIEFVPEMTPLIREINNVLAHTAEASSFADRKESIVQSLSPGCMKTFLLIPEEIQKQLLFDRDPHGNVQVSKIETEKLLEGIVHNLLKKAAAAGNYQGKFATLTHFFGYEGRCAAPSNFDADYTYSLGLITARLVSQALTGYIVALRKMNESAQHWEPVAVPLPSLMIIEQRHGRPKPVIEKALVDLKGQAFADFEGARKAWELADDYGFSGPIQYFGPEELTDQAPLSLARSNR